MERIRHVAIVAAAAAALLSSGACASSGADAIEEPDAGAPRSLADVTPLCVPDCAGRACGFDGCFGQCGVCAAGTICGAAGQCETYVCEPTCAGKACGGDGCGGSCGACPAGETCVLSTGQCKDLDPCGGVTWEGCCEGQVLTYCDAGTVLTVDCADNPQCGWDPGAPGYDCGTDGGSDPTGAFPRSCSGTCSCDGRVCGDDGCGGSCGTCAPEAPFCNADGQCEAACEPACAHKACGPDACGGQCGTCEAGTICDTATGQCAGDACQGVTDAGCCDGQDLYWCEAGELAWQDCAADGPSCGWSAEGGGYYCETDGAEDPSGTYPLACPSFE